MLRFRTDSPSSGVTEITFVAAACVEAEHRRERVARARDYRAARRARRLSASRAPRRPQICNSSLYRGAEAAYIPESETNHLRRGMK